jgi:hypothetical protein
LVVDGGVWVVVRGGCVAGITIFGCNRVVWCMDVISVGGLSGIVGYLFVVVCFARCVSILRAFSSSSCLISIASSLSFVV